MKRFVLIQCRGFHHHICWTIVIASLCGSSIYRLHISQVRIPNLPHWNNCSRRSNCVMKLVNQAAVSSTCRGQPGQWFYRAAFFNTVQVKIPDRLASASLIWLRTVVYQLRIPALYPPYVMRIWKSRLPFCCGVAAGPDMKINTSGHFTGVQTDIWCHSPSPILNPLPLNTDEPFSSIFQCSSSCGNRQYMAVTVSPVP